MQAWACQMQTICVELLKLDKSRITHAMGDGKIVRGAIAEFHMRLEGSVGLVSALVLMVYLKSKARRNLAASEKREVEERKIASPTCPIAKPWKRKDFATCEQSKQSRFRTTKKAFRLSSFMEMMRKLLMTCLRRFPLVQWVRTCGVPVLSDGTFFLLPASRKSPKRATLSNGIFWTRRWIDICRSTRFVGAHHRSTLLKWKAKLDMSISIFSSIPWSILTVNILPKRTPHHSAQHSWCAEYWDHVRCQKIRQACDYTKTKELDVRECDWSIASSIRANKARWVSIAESSAPDSIIICRCPQYGP